MSVDDSQVHDINLKLLLMNEKLLNELFSTIDNWIDSAGTLQKIGDSNMIKFQREVLALRRQCKELMNRRKGSVSHEVNLRINISRPGLQRDAPVPNKVTIPRSQMQPSSSRKVIQTPPREHQPSEAVFSSPVNGAAYQRQFPSSSQRPETSENFNASFMMTFSTPDPNGVQKLTCDENPTDEDIANVNTIMADISTKAQIETYQHNTVSVLTKNIGLLTPGRYKLFKVDTNRKSK